MTFDRLKVIKRAENDKYQNSQWVCKCRCGNITIVRGSHLTSGNTRSCGCLDREAVARNNYKHGMWSTRIYNIWRKMKDRCYNPKSGSYRYYGQKGIKVCDAWLTFEGFYKWVKTTNYNDTLSIDRINSLGNYEPSNCRWATIKEQNNNTSKNHFITVGNETRTLQGWADETGLHRSTIGSRLQNGWDMEDAVLMPKYATRSVAKKNEKIYEEI